MYTKCPSCRAELSFLPPANPESLPEGYKHRIKCPHCGVTIGVKINKVDVNATYPNGYPPAAPKAPAYPQQQSLTPNSNALDQTQEETEENTTKSTGRLRNVFIMIFSLIFFALSVLAYALLDKLPSVMESVSIFSGISYWKLLFKDMDLFKELFGMGTGFIGILKGVGAIMPMVLFTVSGISFIIALLGFIFKKYNRIVNLLFGIIIAGAALTTIFVPLIFAQNEEFDLLYNTLYGENTLNTTTVIKDYVKDIISSGRWFYIGGAVLGIIYFVFSILFMKSLSPKEEEEEGDGDENK